MFLTAVWILTKSAFVEGILDGSVLTTGKAVAVSADAFLETPPCFTFRPAYGRTHTHKQARARACLCLRVRVRVRLRLLRRFHVFFECVTIGGVVFYF